MILQKLLLYNSVISFSLISKLNTKKKSLNSFNYFTISFAGGYLGLFYSDTNKTKSNEPCSGKNNYHGIVLLIVHIHTYNKKNNEL